MAYTHMSLQELINTVRWQSEHAHDLILDARNLHFFHSPEGLRVRLEFPDEVAAPTTHFNGQVRAKIVDKFKNGLQAPYWNACEDQVVTLGGVEYNLLAVNANQWLSKIDERRLIRCFTQGPGQPQMARAFLSDTYRRFDNFDLLVGILPELQKLQDRENFTIQSCSVGDDGGRLYLKFSCPKNRREIALPYNGRHVGDVLEFGAEIGGSEIGDRANYAVPWVNRLTCLNGSSHVSYGVRMIHRGRQITDEDMEKFRFSDEILKADDKVLVAKFVAVVHQCLSEETMDNIAADMARAAGVLIPRPIKTVEYLKTKFQLRDSESDAILAAFTSGQDPAGVTLWGLTNAVTATAQNKEIIGGDYERASELEKLGGELLELKTHNLRALVEAA